MTDARRSALDSSDPDAPRSGTNRLGDETSPYLLQHARNPVDWYPWGEQALRRAREDERPILLSIGYAACHWCHVMERESFEDEQTARLMNEHFVCIKIDREERPDLDEIYMAATVWSTGSGGWPMTVFLLPDGKPFFAGTYFPPADALGRPGFPRLLAAIASGWQSDRQAIAAQAEKLATHVALLLGHVSPGALGREQIDRAVARIADSFDARYGGFGGAPKFPAPYPLELLLRQHARTGERRLFEMVTATLDAMARGGIYDQLAGGFARYSTDERWLVPHFEKMLYDNAQLARLYAEASVVTLQSEHARIARETLDYLLAEMQEPEGGFASSTDADSEGVEGKYFVWSEAEIEHALPSAESRAILALYGVRPEGNWEGVNVLHRARSVDDLAVELGTERPQLEELLTRGRQRLLARRRLREAPSRDDKILASWNALAIGAFATGARIFAEPRYLEAASRAARFVLTHMALPSGRVGHSYRAGRLRPESFLEDHALLADALLDLADASSEPEAGAWQARAREITERMVADFADEEQGGFFATAADQPTPVVRPRSGLGGPLPNPSAVAASALERLARRLDRPEWRDRALRTLRSFGGDIAREPRAFPSALLVLDRLLDEPS